MEPDAKPQRETEMRTIVRVTSAARPSSVYLGSYGGSYDRHSCSYTFGTVEDAVRFLECCGYSNFESRTPTSGRRCINGRWSSWNGTRTRYSNRIGSSAEILAADIYETGR